jgi:hypothetical protein
VRGLWTAVALGLAGAASAEVITYPAPADEPRSPEYEVWADGRPVAVYTARTLDEPFANREWDFGGPYSFANFDMDGTVEVRIVARTRSVRGVVVRPESAGVAPVVVDDRTLTLTLTRPTKLSIELDGKRGPLLLFANPLETDAPSPGDEDVIYFGPGVHKPERIEVRTGQTLYLAGGAVVKGAVVAAGDHIRIRGRGILDGSDWPWTKGPCGCLVDIQGEYVEVEGITIRGSFAWTIVPRHSRYVTVRNVKLANGRVQNDDGINPCNSRDVLITDCFIRTDDDCVALKGLDIPEQGNSDVERIVVENSTLWCDRARIFLLGHESRAASMRDITFRDLDIVHFSMTPFLLEPGEEMPLGDVVVEDVRIHGEGQGELIRLRPVVNQYMQTQVPGTVRDVRFARVTLEGAPGGYAVQVLGADADHDVRRVVFDEVSLLGRPLTEASPEVQIGAYVRDVVFVGH